VISPAAFRLHAQGTAISAVRGRPGLVLDEYLASLTEADVDYLGDDPVFLAAELCAAGIWEAVAGGYRVLDVEAVQVCADRVREFRERDANNASGPGPGPLDRIEPGPVGAAGTTRFGELNRLGEAVFRCARCTRAAAIVCVVRADVAADMGRPAGPEIIAEGLVLDRFLGTSWHAEPAGILDTVQALIEQGNVDPVAIRAISDTLWKVTPFYCPECRLNYCAGAGTSPSTSSSATTTASWAPARTGIGTLSTDQPSRGFNIIRASAACPYRGVCWISVS